jgi:hypothetical protein
MGQHARQRRAVARRVVLAVPPPDNHERRPVVRSRAGANIRPTHGVHPVRNHRCRRATELAGTATAREPDRGAMAVSVELRRPLACWPARRSLLGDTGHRLHRLPQDRAGRVVQARSAVQFAGHLQRAFQSAGRPRQAPERPHLDASKKWASLIFPLLERPPTATAGKAMPSTGRSAGRTHSNLLTALMGTRMLQRRWRLPELRWREAEIRQFRMPKIAPLIYDSVFYLFSRNPKSGDVEGPYGTGFIVGRQKEKRGATHYYAVTNWHLACEDGSSILRINTRAGGVRFIETDPSEWEFFAQSDDLAVADITDTVDVNRDEISCIMEEMFVTSDIIKEFDIRGGTDTFMCGVRA